MIKIVWTILAVNSNESFKTLAVFNEASSKVVACGYEVALDLGECEIWGIVLGETNVKR